MEETTLPQTGEVPDGSEAQAVATLLSRWQKTEEPPKQEATEEPEQEQAQADAQVTEEPEAESEEEADIEFDFAGEKFKLPAAHRETVEKLTTKAKNLLGGADQRFKEAAEIRKAVEAERVSIAQMRKITEATADLIADHRMIARRLEAIAGVDINSTDTDTLTRLNAEYTQLVTAKQQIEQAYQGKAQELTKAEKDALRSRQELAEKAVAQRIKDWSPEKQKALAEYAIGRGAPPEALNQISEAWMVEILNDAEYGRRMREHKSTVEKRVVEAKPTLKPGASAPQPRAAAQAQEAVKRVQKTGSVSDGAAALLALAQVRRK